jgi:phosphoserine phosphatase RsbU/P
MNTPDPIVSLLAECFPEGGDSRAISRAEMEVLLRKFSKKLKIRTEEEDAIYLANLLDHLPDKVYFKDANSNFIKVNRFFAESHGFADPEQMVGKSDFDLFSYKLAIQKFADEQRVMQRNEVLFAKDESHEFADGRSEWVSTTKSPLYSKNGTVMGTFGISRDITDRKLAEIRLQHLADELQHKNSQIEADMEMARKVQAAFIPTSYPSFIWDLSSNRSALDFFHRYIPSETLAGDFFQVIPISNSQAGVIICDVMGHGIRASLVTAVLKGLVGEMKLITPYPHVFLRKVNRSLNAVLKQIDSLLFVTAFYGVIDLLKGQFHYANAGHPMPLILRRSLGTAAFLPQVAASPEPALGLLDSFRYSFRTIPIQANDSFFFYTDGITELESPEGEGFGVDRLIESIQRPETDGSEQVLADLFDRITAFRGGEGFPDDICAVSMDVIRIAENA